MTDAIAFSVLNVGVGFCVSWILTHYLLPYMLGVPVNKGKSFTITMVFTASALLRNLGVYTLWTL